MNGKILVVAGHGGRDSGAISIYNEPEATMTREFVNKLSQYIDCITHTETDLYTDIKNKQYDVSLFKQYDHILEIHFNSSAKKDFVGDGFNIGTEVLVHTKENDTSTAVELLTAITSVGYRNRGVKRRDNLQNMNYAFLQGVNYALLEVCFINDADDLRIYRDNIDTIVKRVAEVYGYIGETIPYYQAYKELCWKLSLSDNTMAYLNGYDWNESLIQKMAMGLTNKVPFNELGFSEDTLKFISFYKYDQDLIRKYEEYIQRR